MDRRERSPSLNDTLLAALNGWQSGIYTALPGIVESFNASAHTCEVQPAIKAQFTSPVDGSKEWIDLPLLVDCPVLFQSGGGCTLTFPIQQGDECLIIFASRCIDAWWQSGGTQQQAVLRMHDLSDGFVFVGAKSQVNVFDVSLNEAQLRTDDGTASIGINPSTFQINIITTGLVNIKAPSIILKNAGAALKKLVNDTFLTLFDSHTHGGVSTGSGNTSVPNTLSSSSNATSVVEAE